jgi:hypothetical protein
MDKTAVLIIVIIISAGALFWIFLAAKSVVIPEGIILFYGEGCSHCKIIDDFITENKIEDKVKFTRMEVWYNKNNQAIISKVAQKCQTTSSSVGVPFLYDGQKCYIGDVDVINFFKTQAGIQ